MSKLMELIGEGRAIFASVLCLLSCVLLAPSAVAETPKIGYFLALEEDGNAYKGSSPSTKRAPDWRTTENMIPSDDVRKMGLSFADGVWTMENFHFDTTNQVGLLVTNRVASGVVTLVVKGENSIKTGDGLKNPDGTAKLGYCDTYGLYVRHPNKSYILGDGKLTMDVGRGTSGSYTLEVGAKCRGVINGPTIEVKTKGGPQGTYILRAGELTVTNAMITLECTAEDVPVRGLNPWTNVVVAGTSKIIVTTPSGSTDAKAFMSLRLENHVFGARKGYDVLHVAEGTTKGRYVLKDAADNVAPEAVVTKPYDARQVITSDTEIESGKVYTAAPLGGTGDAGSGGMVRVDSGTTLTGKDVTFANNLAAENGGAILNGGCLALTNVDFVGNEASQGGAIFNSGTVNFDGTVTLVTKTDTICNTGTLNWNLTKGKAGVLNGYDKLSNVGGTLQLTIDDALVAPTNIVIATGVFFDIAGKDTFVIANVTSGATGSIRIGGTTRLDGTWWRLATEGANLVLSTPPMAKLSNVEIVDAETGVTNATAVVTVGGITVDRNEDGSYTVPQGCELTLAYKAQDDFMFGSCLKTKTVVLAGLTGDYAMTAEDKPATEAHWVDAAVGRTIAIDTRTRKVVGSPEEVLPIAYSTNAWGECSGGSQVKVIVCGTGIAHEDEIVPVTNVNGYAEWMPAEEAYGIYTLQHSAIGATATQISADIYYSQPYALTWSNAGGTLSVTNAGAAIASGDEVLGYEFVDVAVTPEEHALFDGWSLLTNGVAVADAFDDPTAPANRFEMPCAAAELKANFVVDPQYKADSALAASNAVEKAKEEINALRRLTEEEKKAACAELDLALCAATNAIAGASLPKDVADALEAARTAAKDKAKAAKALADGKPYDLIVADDFEAIADEGSYDPETGGFTVDGVAYTNGVNAFLSFADAFRQPDAAFTTNVHVYGMQLIEGDVPNIDPWTLDLVDAVLSVGVDGEGALYASLTNSLAAIGGSSAIVFGKTKDDETDAVGARLAELMLEGAEIVIKPADATPEKKGDDVAIKVVKDTESEGGVAVLPQVASETGNITVTVRQDVTNDTLVAGKLIATNGLVRVDNLAKQSLAVVGGVFAKDFVIDNYGHFDAVVEALRSIGITNRSCKTIVGTYEGSSIDFFGIDFAAISNVTLKADSLVLSGENALTGALTVDSPAATNDGCLAWDVSGGRKPYLNGFGAFANTANAAFEVVVDTAPTNAVYVLAGDAASADGRTFHVVGFEDLAPIAVVVNGGTVYPGSKSFSLAVNGAGELVFTVDWGVSPQMRAQYAETVTNAANAAIAEINAVETLTPAETAALTAKVNEAAERALAVIRVTNVPMEAEAAIAAALTDYGRVLAAAEKSAEGVVRFAQHRYETESGTTLDVLVYGGSTNRSTAATLSFVKGTYTSKPKVFLVDELGFETKAKLPLALNWDKGDRVPKTVRFKIARCGQCSCSAKLDRFFTLQLGSEVASTVGAVDVATVTVLGSKGGDETPYVRALAWPANGGKVTGSRKLASARTKATLRAKANRWATFAGWYRAKADNPDQIDLENGFVSSDRAIKVTQDEAGTYFAYFTDVLPVIAVDDPDLSCASGIAADEDGVATCTVGLNVMLPLSFTTAEGDDTGRLTVSKLPKGLKYSRKTGLVTGVPSKAGVYEVQLKGKNRAGKHTLTYTIVVLPMEDALVGTFAGDLLDSEKESVGGVTLKVSQTGSITAKVKYGRKTYTFSTKGFVDGADGVCVFIEKRKVGVLTAVPVTDASGQGVGKFEGTLSGVAFGDQELTFEAE